MASSVPQSSTMDKMTEILRQAHTMILEQQERITELESELDTTREEATKWKSRASKTLFALDKETAKCRRLEKLLKECLDRRGVEDEYTQAVNQELGMHADDSRTSDTENNILKKEKPGKWDASRHESNVVGVNRRYNAVVASSAFESRQGVSPVEYSYIDADGICGSQTSGYREDQSLPSAVGLLSFSQPSMPSPPSQSISSERSYNPLFDPTQTMSFRVLPDHLLNREATTRVIVGGKGDGPRSSLYESKEDPEHG